MATPAEKLAASLARLQELQTDGRRVFRSNELTRVHRQRLVQHGFLQPVIKGWLIASSPGTDPGDTTPWYSSFWEFCARYCRRRFGGRWYLSPERSLQLHAENTTIPKQVIVHSPDGTNNSIELPFGTSLFDLKQDGAPPDIDLTYRDGLRVFTLEAALVRVPAHFYERHPVDAQMALATASDGSGVLRRLLDGGHSTVAGRVAGAFRRVGRPEAADEILATMRAAGYDVRETDPFAPQHTFGHGDSTIAPVVGRLEALWESLRPSVAEAFPEAPGLPGDTAGYLRSVDDIYNSDSYHSLSIEGYRVSPELIERVASGAWDPDRHADHRDGRDALTARGYWQAFQLVKDSVAKAIVGENAGALVRDAHREWYRELFQPSVAAGLLPVSALAGYRNSSVHIRGSRHVPSHWETIRDAMPALFALMENEQESSVRAVLGHWLFGYVHPYSDGNGRMARFTMNVMLASGGYPWIVIRTEDRDPYLDALEAASVDVNIEPFARFIGERVRRSMARKP
jgi:fido (protein-threonine AMPylation protein)